MPTNWQFASSAAALTAFRNGVANPIFGSGLMPAEIKGTVVLRKDAG